MPGKHDQSTHGHGKGQAGAEGQMAAKLNGGGHLDPSDPVEARLHGAIQAWTGPDDGENAPAKKQVIAEAKAAHKNPTADTDGALLLRTTAAAPATAPELYRGLYKVPASKIPKEGQTLDLGLSSFSQKQQVGHTYAGYGDKPGSVMLRLSAGSRSLDIRTSSHEDYQGNQEWLSTGRFKVLSVGRESFSNAPLPGTFELTVVHIAQVAS